MENKGAIMTFAVIIVIFLTIVFIGTGFQNQKYDVDISNLEGIMLGNAKSPITIVEWGDFSCTYCGDFANNVLPKLKAHYIDEGEVTFIYKHFPREDKTKALAAECANEQGKFWEYHNALYGGSQITGLDEQQFNSCVSSRKYLDKVNKDFLDGINIGVRATPTFIINSRIIEGAIPYETFVKLIDQELNN